MKHLIAGLTALLLANCAGMAPAYAEPPTPPPPRLTPAEIARLLPEPKATDEPSMWYGPFDLRTASIA